MIEILVVITAKMTETLVEITATTTETILRTLLVQTQTPIHSKVGTSIPQKTKPLARCTKIIGMVKIKEIEEILLGLAEMTNLDLFAHLPILIHLFRKIVSVVHHSCYKLFSFIRQESNGVCWWSDWTSENRETSNSL